MVLALQ